MANTKEYLIKTVYDSTGLQKFASDVEKAKTAGAALGLSLGSSAKVVDQSVTTSFNKAGQAVRNVTTIFEQNGQKSKVAFQEIQGSVNPAASSLKSFGDTAQKVDIDLGKLISRALVTIPIWFALRAAITGVIFGIRDGFKDIASFDLELQKLKRNLTGTPEEITTNFKTAKDEITKFSLETGKSVEEISKAVKNFATIGFDFKNSLSAGLDATRLSILLFGDAGDTANAFASAMKLLVKEGEGLPPVSQQISEAFALTAELAKTNKDNLGELTQGLNKFSATAATANLSAKETITLLLTLATAGRSGSQAGTLLSTTFNNLLTNMDKVSKAFGIQFNPAVDSGFQTLLKVLDATEKLSKQPGGEIQVIEKLKDVLGGERGTKIVSSLLAVNDILKENMKVTGDLGRFHEGVKTVLESESGQAQILGNNFKELGKSFVKSLVGADDFTSALKKITEAVTNAKPAIEGLGVTIGNFGKILTFQWGNLNLKDPGADKLDKIFKDRQLKIAQALRGELPKAELEAFKIDFSKIKTVGTTQEAQLMAATKAALDKALSKEEVTAQLGATSKVAITPTISKAPEAIRSLENELAELKARLKAKGASDIQLSLLNIDFLQSKSLQDIDKIRDEQSKVRIKRTEEQLTLQEALLKAVEEQAKAEGASNFEAISRRIELENNLGIEKTGKDLLMEQLELQRALTEETKKTREERLKDLANLIKKTPSQFASVFGNNTTNLDAREQSLRQQASFRGISDEQVNKILHPEDQARSGLLRDLQNGLANPMSKSMGSLESAISGLTQTILQQESKSLGVSVPKWPTPVVTKTSDVTLPGTKANRDIQQVMEDF